MARDRGRIGRRITVCQWYSMGSQYGTADADRRGWTRGQCSRFFKSISTTK